MTRVKGYTIWFKYISIITAFVLSMTIIPKDKYAFAALLFLLILFLAGVARFTNAPVLTLMIDLMQIAAVLAVIYFFTFDIWFLLFYTVADLIYLKEQRHVVFVVIILGTIYIISFSSSVQLFTVLFLMTAFYVFLNIMDRELAEKEDIRLLNEQSRKNNIALEQAKQRIMKYSKEIERISQLEERNRISTELHDSVGHGLSAVLLQLDAAIELLGRDNENGMDLLQSAYENLNKGINEIRENLKKLKPKNYRVPTSSLLELSEKFTADTDIRTHLRYSGNVQAMMPGIETVFYRNAREALTNSLKHGQVKNIYLELKFLDDMIIFTITDDGKGCASISKGLGLSGMEERMKTIGGRIRFNGDKGFKVIMEVDIFD